MKKKFSKTKLYELIGRATTGLVLLALNTCIVYNTLSYILNNCITVYR